MSKKFLIAGNWKMNTLKEDSSKLVHEILSATENLQNSSVESLICPPFTHLSYLSEMIKDKKLNLGAQNCHYEESGAFTGEISPQMIRDLKCEYVIIGHSERRTIFGETDLIINKKLMAAVKTGLKVIFCIGETLDERDKDLTFKIIEKQISEGLQGYGADNLNQLVIAYEPVWAIGTGVVAKPEQAEEAHNFIRELLVKKFGNSGEEILILYGGSMKPDNAEELLMLTNVNGGLIGGASLKSDSFVSIIQTAYSLIN